MLIRPDKEFKKFPWHEVEWGIGKIVEIHRNQLGDIRTIDVRQPERGKQSRKKVRHGVQNFAPLKINRTLEEFMAEVRQPAALPAEV